MSMSDDNKKDDCCGKDMLVPGPDLGNGYRAFSRHMPDHTVVQGVMRPLKDGEPIMSGGVFALTPRNDGTPVCDVKPIDIPGLPEPMCDCACSGEGHAGPARVSTPAFRSGWDRIFGGEPEVGKA
jgi:hypothetical protein